MGCTSADRSRGARQTISRPYPEVARRLRDRYPPRNVWVSRSAHASSEHPDLDRFVKPVRPPGADTVKRREIAREVACGHTATTLMTT